MGKPSGFALLEWSGKRLQLIHLSRIGTHEQLSISINELVGPSPCWIGLDAPVLIRNRSGMRDADRVAHELFSRERAGCYPVNLGLPFASGVLQFVDGLRSFSFSTDAPILRQMETRCLFEVYPHSASVRLFGLNRILPYKKGREASRRIALESYRKLIEESLASRRPSFVGNTLPLIGPGLHGLKECEDQLDAVLCAYVAAHFWYWGLARNNILGNEENGWIVNPSF